MDVLVLLWVAVPAVVMVHASVCDVRSREVPDIHWAVIGASGAILSTLSVRDVGALGAVSTMAGSLLLLAYMLSERLSGAVAVPVVAASAVLTIAPFAADPGNPFARAAVASFVTFFAMFAMYRIGLITGGADAKCLMSFSIAFPVYPESGTIPLVWVPEPSVALLMNPTVSVLVMGLVISLTSCAWVVARNIRDGYVGRRMFTTYRMGVSSARTAFVWPAERLDDGVLVPHRGFDDRDEVLEELYCAGVSDVRVTPMIPFIVPLTAAFLIVTVLGSPLSVIGARCQPSFRTPHTCRRRGPRCQQGIPGV